MARRRTRVGGKLQHNTGKCKILHYEFQENKAHDFSPVANHIKANKPVFAIFYMRGCGPCEAARPEWNKLKNFQDKLPQHALLLEIDHVLKEKLYESLQPMFAEIKTISSFPTITLMHNGKMEPYSGAQRTVDHFKKWIHEKADKTRFGGKGTSRGGTRKGRGIIGRGGKTRKRRRLL